jgi:hypothetical protein
LEPSLLGGLGFRPRDLGNFKLFEVEDLSRLFFGDQTASL